MSDLERARAQLADIDARLDALRDERARVRWHQRARRIELDLVADGWLRSQSRWRSEVARLERDVVYSAPPVSRAVDPLDPIDRGPRRAGRTRAVDRDHGLDR
jgi:hypothetical protein